MKNLIKFFQGKMVDKQLLEEANIKIEKLDKIISNKNFEYLSSKEKYEKLYNEELEINKLHQEQNGKLLKEIDSLKLKVREINGAKGGLTKQINKLTKQLEESTKKYEEFTKNKFIIRDLPKNKTKGHQKMQIYSNISRTNSNIIRKEKEK